VALLHEDFAKREHISMDKGLTRRLVQAEQRRRQIFNLPSLMPMMALLLGIVLSGIFFSHPAIALDINETPRPHQVMDGPGLGRSSPMLVSLRSSSSSRPSDSSDQESSMDASPSAGTMPSDIQTIVDRGKLIVALLDTDNPPFFMAEEGDRLNGLDVQLARDLADKLGVRVEFNRSATTFNEVVDNVFNQEADIAISKISRTMKRVQRVRFSEPYLRMRQGLLINRLKIAQQTKGRTVPETIRALEGNVGVIEGSSYVGFLNQKFPDATIVEYPSWQDIVQAVIQGDILAAYRDELEIKKVVRTSPNAALQLETIALTDTEDPIAMVLPWTSTHLLALVDQYLDTEKLNYSADTVLRDYADYFDQ
jgi:ABC-type amino acid transport substrate-binding protein